MNLRRTALSFVWMLALLLGASATLQAQTFNSGSTELDIQLTNINKTASLNLSLFKSDLKSDYAVSSGKIDYLFSLKLQPAEVFLTLELGRISGKSIDLVVKTYQAHKGQGWGVIAKQLGIKPGSPQFHALKASAKGKSNKAGSDKGNKPVKGNNGQGKGGKKH